MDDLATNLAARIDAANKHIESQDALIKELRQEIAATEDQLNAALKGVSTLNGELNVALSRDANSREWLAKSVELNNATKAALDKANIDRDKARSLLSQAVDDIDIWQGESIALNKKIRHLKKAIAKERVAKRKQKTEQQKLGRMVMTVPTYLL